MTQGKRPDQVQFSTNVSMWCMILTAILLAIALVSCNEYIPDPPEPDASYYGDYIELQIRSDKHVVYVYPCDSDMVLNLHYHYVGNDWRKSEQWQSDICPIR